MKQLRQISFLHTLPWLVHTLPNQGPRGQVRDAPLWGVNILRVVLSANLKKLASSDQDPNFPRQVFVAAKHQTPVRNKTIRLDWIQELSTLVQTILAPCEIIVTSKHIKSSIFSLTHIRLSMIPRTIQDSCRLGVKNLSLLHHSWNAFLDMMVG